MKVSSCTKVYIIVNYVGFNIIAVCKDKKTAEAERIKYQKPTIIVEKELI